MGVVVDLLLAADGPRAGPYHLDHYLCDHHPTSFFERSYLRCC